MLIKDQHCLESIIEALAKEVAKDGRLTPFCFHSSWVVYSFVILNNVKIPFINLFKGQDMTRATTCTGVINLQFFLHKTY
jgi:hypothetical protein